MDSAADTRLPRPARVAPAPLRALLADAPGAQLLEPAPGGSAQPGRVGVPMLISGASLRSDDVRPGDLFAALPGQRAHGIEFLDRALANGAAAVLTDSAGAGAALAAGAPVLVCPDPREALGPVSSAVYGHPSSALSVIGITGTSGKTTTAVLAAAGLRGAGVASGTIGTLGAFVGDEQLASGLTTPEAPQLHALLAVMLERGARAVAMEVSSHALQLARVGGVAFAAAGFTNLSRDHLDFHGDIESYFAAKRRLFDGRARRHAVCIDDEWGRRLAREPRRGGDVTVAATDPAADWTPERIAVAADGSTRFTARSPVGRFGAGTAIPGAYNVANALLALALIAAAGADPRLAAGAVAAAHVPGRMERIDAGQPFLAVVDYSHKPDAVRGALAALRALTPGRLIVVLGCGGERDAGKRPLMGRAAAEGADVVYITDDNPRGEDPAAIRSAMMAGALQAPPERRAQLHESDRRARAIADALAQARPGDAVLVAGKGHETGQEVAGVVHPFDDRSAVREALGALGHRAAAADAPGTGR